MTEKGTADITIMIIDVVTTKGMTMIKVMAGDMIVVTMIVITVVTAIATTTTTETFRVFDTRGLLDQGPGPLHV
jgi:hypothetical protein